MSVRILVLVILVGGPACAKVTVHHVDPSAAENNRLKEEGVFYALPKTVAKVQVKIEKAEKTTAPYMMFAPIFAAGADALCDSPNKCRTTKDSVSYKIVQGASFSTFGEPDPAHVYLVKLAGGGTIDQKISIVWTDTGLPTSVSATVTNRTIDVAVAGVKMATNLGSKRFLGAERVSTAVQESKCPEPTKASKNDKWVIDELKKITDPTLRSLTVSNYCDMKQTTRDEYEVGTDQQILAGAVQAFELRVAPYANARFNMLTAGANLLEPMAVVDRLDAIIDATLKTLFLGSTKKESWEPAFEMRDLDPAAPRELLQLDTANGPCPKGTLAFDAKPMPAAFKTPTLDCKKSHEKVEVTISLHPSGGQLFQSVAGGVAQPTEGDRSFRYRIPAQVRATVISGVNEFGSSVFSVAQLGRVASLPSRRASKELSYDLGFVEATGGLKSFKLGSTGNIDAQTLQALSDAGGTVLDARSKKRLADEKDEEDAAKAADELTLITRQHTLLKLKHEICEIQKKYGFSCTVEP
jgi:hypothetical protein